MISKFASMRDSWFTKIILGVTALSFMSLFGVSGYINSANNNKTVIQVGDLTVSQSEFNVALQKQLAKLRARGMVDDENADQIKNELIKVLAEAKLEDAIIQNAMNKYKIDFRPEVVGTIITNSPQFMGRDGRFDRALFNEYLRIENKSEAEVVQDVKQNLARQILVDTQVAYANVPQVLIKQMQKVLNQRRTFNYVKINNRDAKITRQPSEDELNRIYDDFSEELTVPEKRRITVLFLNNDMIEKSVEAHMAFKVEMTLESSSFHLDDRFLTPGLVVKDETGQHLFGGVFFVVRLPVEFLRHVDGVGLQLADMSLIEDVELAEGIRLVTGEGSGGLDGETQRQHRHTACSLA